MGGSGRRGGGVGDGGGAGVGGGEGVGRSWAAQAVIIGWAID